MGHWLSGKRYWWKLRIISEEQIEHQGKDCEFLGAVHDIGKATPAFPERKKVKCKFSRFGYSVLENWNSQVFWDWFSSTSLPKSHHSIAGQYLLSLWRGEDIAAIIGGHHGRPVSDLEV